MRFSPGAKFAQNVRADKFASMVHGCSFDNFLTKTGTIEVYAYLKQGNVEEAPARIKGCALALTRSKQMAVIQPPAVSTLFVITKSILLNASL